VQIVYASRARGDTTDRVVSPQRLVHYRDNWYLDAYCHLRERLSTFSIDAMVRVQALKESAIEISGQEISFPYSDTRELMMDIMRHGADVRVIAPDSLRALVISKHREATDQN
jgi:predicted DNA-binding transcriptional regulator YafY